VSGKIFDLTPESVPARRAPSAQEAPTALTFALRASAARTRLRTEVQRAAEDAAWLRERQGLSAPTEDHSGVADLPAALQRQVSPEEWAAAVQRATEERVRMRAWLAQRRAAEAAEAAEAGVLQAQAEVGREGGALSPDLSGRIQAKRGGGQPLEATVRRGMEGVFGVSFGHVRVHADPEADALNQGVAAIAFTVGADIFFRAGAYQPHSVAGQHLLAHELTHVVQQRTGSLGPSSGNASGTMTVGAADDRHEQEAEATAHRVTAALQRRALLAQATPPGAGIARRHDPTLTLTPAAPGVRRAPLPGQDPPVFPVSFPAIVYYPGGANIHTHPAVGSPVVALLPSLTTRVMVTGKTTTSNQASGTPDWYEVRVSAGPHAGKVGFLQHVRVDSRWPAGDPDPTLYVIQPGDTALGLAARFYGLAGSAHPETNADLRRYVEVLVRVNQRGSYWIDKPDDGDPLNWMRAQVRATYAMWVPSRAWAGKAAGAVPNPSLTGGAWATMHQQLRAQGWGGVTILQAVSLFAQDVAVVGDRAVGALRHAIVVSGTLLGEVTAETARAVLPVLQDLASAAVAPAVLMARLGALAARKLADVPAALLTLLERKAHELLASLLGAPVLARLGGAVQAILKDPGTFIGNLVAALNAGVGHLIDHVAHHFGEDALGWLIGKLGAGIPLPRSLALADLLPTVQDLLGLTRAHLRDLVVQRIVRTQRISAQQAGQLVDKAGNLVARLDSLAHKAWGALTGGQAPRLVQQLVDGVRDGLRDWLWGQLITLGLKVLVELSTPLVGEVIALIQAVYAAVQTFLQYEGTLKEVFGTIVGTFADLAEHKDVATATRIGQGVIGPTLVRLIVPALDFLAGLFGIGKIADGVQKALQAVRSKVEKALTPLIAALADAVRGVAGGRGHGGQDAPGAPPHQDNPKHEAIAQQIVTKLEHIEGAPKGFAATRTEKEGEAGPLKARYQPQLEKGINLSITFATKPDDAGGKETLDFTVVIAPNTTTKSGRIPVEKIDPSVEDAQAGTRAHPFPIIWPKPASKDYPVLYFGGRSKAYISQADLKKNVGKQDATGTVIQEYKPETGGALADGTRIGVAPRWHLRIGTVVGPLSNAKTPGGGKITAILQKFGFSGDLEKLDGDHVHEIQVGGEDIVDNLWPLYASPNRGAGSIISRIVVHYPSGKTITTKELKKTANARDYFFKVVECKP